ncbi:hypothetical protein OTU49_003298, partial [Cherax quadricarinatus]
QGLRLDISIVDSNCSYCCSFCCESCELRRCFCSAGDTVPPASAALSIIKLGRLSLLDAFFLLEEVVIFTANRINMPRDFTDFEFNFLTSDDSEEIIKFLDEQLAPRVPLIKATGETSASLLGKIYMRDVLNCLESGLSFAARHKTTKTIAGVALSEIFSLEETLKVAAM